MNKSNLMFLNKKDEQQRFTGLEVYLSSTPVQQTSHGYSYLYLREQYRELGDVPAFDTRSFQKMHNARYGDNNLK